MKPTIINVVSGKGGTGKTLLACVLADMLGNAPDTKVIVVDLDFFVRGLTSLLYFHREEKLHLTSLHEVPVSSFFINKRTRSLENDDHLAILKYRSFDVVPAVSRIDERLNFQDIGPDNKLEAKAVLNNLLAQIPLGYNFIILDSRAGYDELIAATHELSDVSVCVEEQDPISRVTADNLVSQLDQDSKTPLFRLINKAKGVASINQLDERSRSIAELGLIPFDMDVLNNFGSADFWEQISRSLYRWALAQAWNRLSSKLQLEVKLNLPRLSPIANTYVEARIGMLSLSDRIIFSYGILLGVCGILYGLWGREFFYLFRYYPDKSISLLIGFMGFALALYSFLKKRKITRSD